MKSIYGNIMHLVTGERPDQQNPFSQPILRVPDAKNWSPIEFAKYSGPGTTMKRLMDKNVTTNSNIDTFAK